MDEGVQILKKSQDWLKIEEAENGRGQKQLVDRGKINLKFSQILQVCARRIGMRRRKHGQLSAKNKV